MRWFSFLFLYSHTVGLRRKRRYQGALGISWWILGFAECFQSLIILKSQLSKMTHQKEFFWLPLRLPKPHFGSTQALVRQLAAISSAGSVNYASVSSLSDNWSGAAARPPEPQAPSHGASRAAIGCELQPGTARLRAPGRHCGEEEHCFSAANFGKVPGSCAGLRGSLGSGAVTAVSWSAPAGTDLVSLWRLFTWLLSSVLPFLRVLRLPCASWTEVVYLVGWRPWR